LKPEDISGVAIIGAGTMGAGISLCMAQADYPVMLYDIRQDQIDAAFRRVRNSQEVLIQEGLLTRDRAEAALGVLRGTTSLKEALAGAQFVLEAAPEVLELKHKLFSEMESICAREVVIATNTSGLGVTAIASVCRHPERVGGMHWVNPPELVPLVEVIRGEKTSRETLALIRDLAERLGKMPVIVQKDVPGFALNRLQFAVFREALHLVETGVVSPEDVDRTMRCGLGFRYPWLGPLQTADLGGLDIFYSVATYLFEGLSSATVPPASFKELIEAGKLGLKTGEGFYKYEAGSRDEILRKRDLYFIRQWKLIQDISKQ
jgi:3-hydroxybutyryl-CoA dehydrogenase